MGCGTGLTLMPECRCRTYCRQLASGRYTDARLTFSGIPAFKYNCSTSYSKASMCVYFSTSKNMDVQGVSLFTASSIDVQGVPLFTTSSVNVQGISQSIEISKWRQGDSYRPGWKLILWRNLNSKISCHIPFKCILHGWTSFTLHAGTTKLYISIPGTFHTRFITKDFLFNTNKYWQPYLQLLLSHLSMI